MILTTFFIAIVCTKQYKIEPLKRYPDYWLFLEGHGGHPLFCSSDKADSTVLKAFYSYSDQQ